MQAAIAQILTSPFRGAVHDIFLESKALELLALQMNALLFKPYQDKGARQGEPVGIDPITVTADKRV